MTLVLQSAGSAVTGHVEFADSPCFANATLSGTLQSSQLMADIVDSPNKAALRTTLNGGTMVGTYVVTQGTTCTGDEGSVALARRP